MKNSLLSTIESQSLHIFKTKRLPTSKLRGFKRELSEMYAHRDPAIRIVASILHGAYLQQAPAFVLTKSQTERLVESDPNISGSSNIRENYRQALGILKSFGSIKAPKRNKAAVVFLNQQTLQQLNIIDVFGVLERCEGYLAKFSAPTAAPAKSLAQEIWETAGPDEEAWDSAMSDFPESKYEEIRAELKNLRSQYHQLS